MKKILIADDSETLRHQLSEDLQEAGFDVQTAVDGLAAISAFQSDQDFDAAILDVNMPGATGIDVLRRCIDIIEQKNVVVFMLTTDSSAELKEAGRQLKVRAWITKPYQKESLVGALKKVLNL